MTLTRRDPCRYPFVGSTVVAGLNRGRLDSSCGVLCWLVEAEGPLALAARVISVLVLCCGAPTDETESW